MVPPKAVAAHPKSAPDQKPWAEKLGGKLPD